MADKYIATAKITDPTAVQSRCSANGWQPHKGAIFCHIPELGYEGSNFIYCRNGLSVPYLRPRAGDRLLVEPTIGENERWFYTGFVDAQDNSVSTTDIMRILLNGLGTQKISATTTGILIQNASNQSIEFTSSGITIQNSTTSKIEFTATSIKITFGSNTIELDNTSVKINGTNHEVLP